MLTIYFFLLLLFHQEKLKDKDVHIDEIRKLLSERQEMISKLEQDLSKCKLELNEREKRINDILQVEVHFLLVLLLMESCSYEISFAPFSS
jgi:DNA-binding transcriptional MerR regulator